MRISLRPLRELTFPRKGRKVSFTQRPQRVFPSSLRALRFSLRALRELIFFHAKGAKVFSFLFFAISGLRFFIDKDIGYVKLSTSFNDCDTQLKLLYHHQFTFHAYPRYH